MVLQSRFVLGYWNYSNSWSPDCSAYGPRAFKPFLFDLPLFFIVAVILVFFLAGGGAASPEEVNGRPSTECNQQNWALPRISHNTVDMHLLKLLIQDLTLCEINPLQVLCHILTERRCIFKRHRDESLEYWCIIAFWWDLQHQVISTPECFDVICSQ